MKKLFFLKAISGLINILSGLLAATIFLFFQDWFGSGDLSSYIYWTLPIVVGLSISGETILELFKSKNVVLRLFFIIIIAAIISFGWVFCLYLIIGPWINAFSIPVFYLWIIGSVFQLLFLDLIVSKPTEQLKSSQITIRLLGFPLTVVVTVLLLFVFSSFSSYLTRPEPKTFLIPKDYDGMVRVVYGEDCGIEPEHKNSRRILRIPDNGLLIVQPKFKAGIIDHQYYFIDEGGNQEKATGIQLGSSGSFGGPMPDGSYSTESPTAIHFSNFFATSDSSGEISEKNYALENKRIDSLTKALVEKCRSTQE